MTNQRRTDLERLLDSIMGDDGRKFLAASNERLPSTFRFNELKHDLDFQRALIELEGFEVKESLVPSSFELSDSDGGPIGKSLAHFLGHIYIQDLASMLPPILLNPKRGERILDMCAAPGSKSTQIASLMGNRGTLVVNDISRKRQRSLIFNLRRCGVTNAIVLNLFGEQFGNRYFETFDRILLDPPCSALGTVHKSPEVLAWWTPARTKKLARSQLSLMQSALKALRPGGILVYSTCTITPEENEEIVNFAVSQFPVEVETIEVPGMKARPGVAAFGENAYSSQVERAVRIYPHDTPCEGFFIARLRKMDSFGESRSRRGLPDQVWATVDPSHEIVRGTLSRLSEKFAISPESLGSGQYAVSADLRYTSADLPSFPLYDLPETLGLPLAHIKRKEPKLTTEGCHLLGAEASRLCHDLRTTNDLEAYVNRDPIPAAHEREEQVLVKYQARGMGHALVDREVLLSRFPRIGWRFSLGGV